MPQVTVLIPTYNAGVLLTRAIESVLAQTFQDFDVIVVDDGSTDDTRELMAEFVERDARLQYLRIPHSGGAARPKNVGLEMAKGRYVATLDADDEWLPTKLERQVRLLDSTDVSVGFVSCHALHVDELSGQTIEYRIPRVGDVLGRELARDYLGSGSGVVYRKEVFERVGNFDERLRSGQDWEMRIRLTQHFDFDFVDAVLFRYFFHAGSISNRFDIDARQVDIDYIFNKWQSLYTGRPTVLSEKYRADGTRLMLAGRRRPARRKFIRALRTNPANFKVYFYLLASLTGTRGYRRLTQWKARGDAWLRSKS